MRTDESGREAIRSADGRAFALFLLATILLGVLIPGGAVLGAIAAHFTSLGRSRSLLVVLWAVAGVLTFFVLAALVDPFIPPVATVGPEVVVSD